MDTLTHGELPRRLLGRYAYPTSHRVIELAAVVALTGTAGSLGRRTVAALADRWSSATAMAVAAVGVLAFVLADFLSGLVHSLCDNLGSVDTPIVGQKFIRSFREHHTDPMDMTRGDFIRVNADNFLVCLPIVIPCALWMRVAGHPFVATFVLMLTFAVVMTNQIHKWAHLERAPLPVRVLQHSGLILSPEHHRIHHTAPYDSHYCITSGITNGPLAAIGFWPAFLRSCRWLGRILPGSPAVIGPMETARRSPSGS